MKNKELFHRPITWVVFVLLAVAGVFYIYHNFSKANSLVNVDIQMDREAALEKAAHFAHEFNLGPTGFKQAASFQNDREFQNFIELEAGGLDTFTNIISKGYYHPYQWTVRHFKEQDANEVTFRFKPNGETYGFTEKIPEAREGEALSEDEALTLAQNQVANNWDVDLSPYAIVEKSKEEQINGRVDHTFIYERKDKIINKGEFRLKLKVSGDKLTTVDYHVKIPEDFKRRYSEMRSANQTISVISSAVIILIYGLLGVVFGIFILLRSRRLIWKPALYWGLGIALASMFLVGINHLPFAWFSYDTSMSESNFLSRQLLIGFFGAIAFGAVLALSFMAAEGLGRMAFPKHIQWWKIWSVKTGGSMPILGQTFAGYLFAVIIIAIDVLFYVTTTSHFGWWSPAGTLSDPNILATYLPWFDSIAISLQAGFWEEALFRVIPIAGVFILTKGKKSRNFWIILILLVQTLVFGAAHASYPQQPSYARVIEMIIPFTIMGIIYIYYGILPAVIAHYAVDVFWFSLPLWVSSTQGIWVDRILVLIFLLLPVFIVLFIRLKNRKWNKVPETDKNSGWQLPDKIAKIEKNPEVMEPLNKPKVEKWVLLLGVVGLVVWILFSPFKSDTPKLDLAKNEAIEVAQNELSKKYQLLFEEWTILTSIEDKVDVKDIFVWQEGNEEIYSKMLNSYLAPPHWKIRLVKTKGKAEDKTEEYIVRVSNNKKILSISHKIPEKAEGESLKQEDAQYITDSVLVANYSLNRETLKEVSISPTNQENRTDWEFVYADTTNYPLSQGQGRYIVEIAGNEVTNTNPFVHIPEDWQRDYKEKGSKKSIIRIIGRILIVLVFLLGAVLAIIRWTRKKFNIKAFVTAIVFIGLLHLFDFWIDWPTLMASYNTQFPMGSFITTLLIGIAISGIFVTLFQGIFIGATPGWLPVTKKPGKWNLIYAIALGVCITAIFTLAQSIIPKTKPVWPDFSYLNGSVPWAGLAFSDITNLIIYPVFAVMTFLGIHHFTKGWTTKKWIGIVFALLTSLALVAGRFENYSSWLLSGIILAVAIIAIYHFFIRFHFEWIPISFGILPVMNKIKQMVVLYSTEAFIGGALMVLVSLAILVWWYKLLLKHFNQNSL